LADSFSWTISNCFSPSQLRSLVRVPWVSSWLCQILLIDRRDRFGLSWPTGDRVGEQPIPSMSESYCRKLSTIISQQLSKPDLSTYVERVVKASESISEYQHDLTPEETQLFGILYRAVFCERQYGRVSSNGNQNYGDSIRVSITTYKLESFYR
jgi:hypothetical protein